jgi:hypothetical protein
MLDRLVEAVLYEGYILYPYRPSAKKNAQRFTFGRVYPEAYSQNQNGAEPCTMQTECLLRSSVTNAAVQITVRFLHPIWREVFVQEGGCSDFVRVMEARRHGKLYQTWQECVEREVRLPHLDLRRPDLKSSRTPFTFPQSEVSEAVDDKLRIRRRQEALFGTIEVSPEIVDEHLWKLRVRIENLTSVLGAALNDSNEILMRTFASTHTILQATEGFFVSLLEPPAEYASVAEGCRNRGTWPVLVGNKALAECDTMLSSPIILYDYPVIAPESPGTLYDGTEIDEILNLRIMAMTEEEKTEAGQVDERARQLLERAGTLPDEQLLRLHGSLREVSQPAEELWASTTRLEGISVEGIWVSPGARVRIRPKRRADAMDIFLNGKNALVEAVEQDAEGNVHFALVVEDDPGKDFGMLRQSGHRFFYSSEEVEPLQGPD